MTSSRLASFLTPRSIALVGCPSDLSRPGARPLLYLKKHGYPGQVYPVNPRHQEIGGFRAYPTLSDLPERPDTVWIGVPESDVLPVLEETARLKIPNAVIMTSGFGETDATGAAREARLRAVADGAGVTVLGPNMLGFVNCWERVPLTFSSAGAVDRLIPGALGIASQSGALGGVVVNRAFDRLIGVSAMVSTGNEIGVTVSECLEYFADDERTRAVALVVEGIRDGARFRSAAERLLLAGKPLVALKLGRSTAGQRNALTHTGALAGSLAAWRAVARQLGIVEVDTFEDLVEVGGFLSRESRVVRRGAAVVTTSGGASIMLADQLEAHGVALPRLLPATVEALGRMLPAYARTRDNPVDVTAGLPEALFGNVLEALAADRNLDAIVVAATSGGADRALNIARVAKAADKPVIACWLGGSVIEAGRVVLDEHAVGCFRNPASAARALAAGRAVADARSEWTRRPRLARRPARRVEALTTYAQVAALARSAGVPLVAEALVETPAEAARAARRLGFPVAVKIVSPDLAHKTDAGALALGLDTREAVQRAASRLLRTAKGRRVEGLLVQRMVRGVEVLVGVTRDPSFGQLLVVGAGGIEAELIGDTSCRPLPVTRREVSAMVNEVRHLARLRGFRGAPAADVVALVGAIVAVARMAEMLGDRLTSLDVNPIIVGPRGRGAFAVDLLVACQGEGR
jgi:acyl-CoA synthetase (NDP forming)